MPADAQKYIFAKKKGKQNESICKGSSIIFELMDVNKSPIIEYTEV